MSAARERQEPPPQGVPASYPLASSQLSSRPRGDSIYLPPPIAYDQPASGSRSNSFFSQLVNMPPGSSVSGASSSGGPASAPASGRSRQRQLSMFADSISAEEIEQLMKQPMDILAWDPVAPPTPNVQQQGHSTGSFSDIIQSMISSGSIDFSGMSQAERRDSIIKILSDPVQRTRFQSVANTTPQATKLKEDIFGGIPQEKESPTSQREEPQSPRTSPQFTRAQLPVPPAPVPAQAQPPVAQGSGYPYQQFYQQTSPMEGFFRQPSTSMASSAQFQSPQYKQSTQQQKSPIQGSPEINGSNVVNLENAQAMKLVPAQQYLKSEDGRPLVGATKIDQLMLVIQARDKGITKPIEQAPDGSILGAPNFSLSHSKSELDNDVLPRPVSLVGGVDKPKHEEIADTRKRKKGKQQQCPYCFKYFTQSTHLEVHIRSHIGYKPFKCHYCNKKFTQGGNLRTHLRLHTGEKPFTCDTCHRSFSRKGNLAAHKLTHENLKPFACKLDDCDKSFTQLGNLKSHQNRFHLSTLNDLTHKLAEMTGEQMDRLPTAEKEMLEYFKKLYKNSNKGIRGRGKQTKIVVSESPPSAPTISSQYNLEGKSMPASTPPSAAFPRQQQGFTPAQMAPPPQQGMDWGFRDQQLSRGTNFKSV